MRDFQRFLSNDAAELILRDPGLAPYSRWAIEKRGIRRAALRGPRRVILPADEKGSFVSSEAPYARLDALSLSLSLS